MAHLKRLNAPRSWPVERKAHSWVTSPVPGAHSAKEGIPLRSLIRDVLGHARTAKEVTHILKTRKILVNGRVITDPRFSVGAMDVLDLGEEGRSIVMFTSKGKLYLEPYSKNYRLCRVEGKTLLKGGKIQLNLWGGSNLLVQKDEYSTGDSLKLELKDGKLSGKIELKTGGMVYVLSGNSVGRTGKIKNIDEKTKEVVLEDGKDEFKTQVSRLYPVEK